MKWTPALELGIANELVAPPESFKLGNNIHARQIDLHGLERIIWFLFCFIVHNDLRILMRFGEHFMRRLILLISLFVFDPRFSISWASLFNSS